MANILDYLDWRGDLTLAERGFNEVDNLLMAELCFLDFSGIVPADFSAPVFLPDAMRQYDAARPQETMGVLVPEQIPELGHKMAASRRFSDLTLCCRIKRPTLPSGARTTRLSAGRRILIWPFCRSFRRRKWRQSICLRQPRRFRRIRFAWADTPRAAISRSTAQCSAAKPCRTS